MPRKCSVQAMLVAVVAAALSFGCQATSYIGDENSPFFKVPVGSQLKLNQPLTIAADEVSVYLQAGKIQPWGEIRKNNPHCKFEVFTRHNAAREVMPDEFEIVKTVQELTADAGTLIFAQLMVAGKDMGNTGGLGIQTFATRMDLRSARQPDVFRLTCSQWGHLNQTQHVTIAEIRAALGSVLSLRLPGS